MGTRAKLSEMQVPLQQMASGVSQLASRKAVRRVSLLGLAAAGAISALACSRFFTRQLDELSAGISRVTAGDYKSRVDVPRIGPARKPIREFNVMLDTFTKIASNREDYLSNISHEFKTPLSYIQQYATLLQDDTLSNEERDTYLKGIIADTRRLSSMVSSLLELAITKGTDKPLDMSAYSLDEQLRQAVILFAPIMNRKDIAYDADLDEVTICANEYLIDEVWANILSNAVKFTESGGAIHVRLRAKDSLAQVTIADTGIGMNDEELEHAFERFYRNKTAGQDGTGLGLPIAQAIVERHGGSISLDSIPGAGTTCTVLLPLQYFG